MRLFKRRNLISPLALVIYLRQFAVLINAHIDLIKSCDLLALMQKEINVRQLIYQIKLGLLSGFTLAECFQQCPAYFSNLTCQMIKIGEKTGKLGECLHLIALYEEENFLLWRDIRRSFSYPLIVLLVAILMIIFLLAFVIPAFSALFEDKNKLPLLTQYLFKLSEHVFTFIFIMLMLLVVSIFYWQSIKLSLLSYIKKLPIIQSFLKLNLLIRFSKRLAISLEAGFTILEALKLASMGENKTFMQMILLVEQQLKQGEFFSRALAREKFFPPLFLQMVGIGEESGYLPSLLNKVAAWFEKEMRTQLTFLQRLLEPLIILGLGVLIGGIIICLYLPFFQLGSTFS